MQEIRFIWKVAGKSKPRNRLRESGCLTGAYLTYGSSTSKIVSQTNDRVTLRRATTGSMGELASSQELTMRHLASMITNGKVWRRSESGIEIMTGARAV